MGFGYVLQIVGSITILAANLTWCIAGLFAIKKSMKPSKIQRLYTERNACRIMTFDEWEAAVNVVTSEQGRKSFIFAGISVIWFLANIVINYFMDTQTFFYFAIYGNMIIISTTLIFMRNISKKRYGINIQGLDSLTNAEVKAYEEHIAKQTQSL